MFGQDYIASKLEGYAYFRADIEISIRINAPRQNYGMLMFAFVPYGELATSYSAFQYFSSFPHILVSASSGETHTLTVPFTYNQPGLELASFAGKMGQICVVNVAPLSTVDSSVPATLRSTLFAKFVNPKVWGLQKVAPLSSTPPSITFQSNEAREKSEKGMLSGRSLS